MRACLAQREGAGVFRIAYVLLRTITLYSHHWQHSNKYMSLWVTQKRQVSCIATLFHEDILHLRVHQNVGFY